MKDKKGGIHETERGHRCQGKEVLRDFLPRFNNQFRVPAQQFQMANRALPFSLSLEQTLFFKHSRRVDRDNHNHNHKKIIIFTQFQDTQDYLADRITNGASRSVTCISGQDSRSSGTTREERINRLRQADEGILICTETAAESLNLQFCTAVINYDMPWNPMTVEQRIGRIDRIGQQRSTVDVINLFYEKSAEYDAYRVMARRMKDIENNVGPYRPIMQPNIERIIADAHRTGTSEEDIEKELEGLTSAVTLNLNLLNTEIEHTESPEPLVSMEDLTLILNTPSLLPDGWSALPCGWNERGHANHWRVKDPEGNEWTATTDRAAHTYAPDRLQWWGPGNESFPI